MAKCTLGEPWLPPMQRVKFVADGDAAAADRGSIRRIEMAPCFNPA
jgi:hypothetical protein